MGTPIPIGDEYGTRRLPGRGARRSAGVQAVCGRHGGRGRTMLAAGAAV